MGAVKIGHDFIGGSITGTDSLQGSGAIESYGRIGRVRIGGSTVSGTDKSSGSLGRNATIRVAAVNGDAQIGAVVLGGDGIATNLVAGVTNGGAGFGDGSDAAIAGGSADIVSRIGTIAIRGLVYGTPDASGTDHFGFVAQQIGSFNARGVVINFTAESNAGRGLAPTNGDVTIFEVA